MDDGTFQKAIEEGRRTIDHELERVLDTRMHQGMLIHPFIGESYRFMKDYVLMGGKRLRPIALMASYKGLGGKDMRSIVPVAASVEMIHAHSLILDDIMDEDMRRRGQPGVNQRLHDLFRSRFKDTSYDGPLFSRDSARFTVSNAIMLASITDLSSKIAMLGSGFHDKDIRLAITEAVKSEIEVFQGQMMDVYMEHDKDVDERTYFNMVQRKTADLFSLSVRLGAILAGASRDDIIAIGEYGMNAATAFQIRDDMLDIDRSGGKGNTFGSDIRKGKRTLMVIHALSNAKRDEADRLRQILDSGSATDEEVDEAVGILDRAGSIRHAEAKAQRLISDSLTSLDRTSMDATSKDFFRKFAHLLVKRAA